jgi:hypothetical protein
MWAVCALFAHATFWLPGTRLTGRIRLACLIKTATAAGAFKRKSNLGGVVIFNDINPVGP